ncbi:hypothetical protein [Pantoea sp. A4]|uniref:hypothetical protein n=1 Tax=Pantoea sp. A4 TaxID=1225184 RepID=UPI00036EBBD8|nr:hypothetical protein [Pantoea sp. A4]
MSRSHPQQRIDEIIGEAALALLQQAGPVTLRALVAQLQTMHKLAEDSARRNDVMLALREVRMSIKSVSQEFPEEMGETEGKSSHAFLNTHSLANSRKH